MTQITSILGIYNNPSLNMSLVTGFECEFVEKPPEMFQSSCPICLLILREPYQVTCCGKSFCRACIQKIKSINQPCPTCNQENFTDYSNLGLQQPLYGFKVHCSNKDEGCDWQGELGQLDKHLNLNPDQDKQEIGCAYTKVKCLHCSELYQRRSIKCHQISKCLLRPFSCEMCKEFKSTYDDVVKNHAPLCKCRPVECPNTCGNTLQHQELEEHLSSTCPLSMVECEFSHAGCDVKMHRKDLPSHISESMVTHMSLLARENKRLNTELQKQKYSYKELKKEVVLVKSSVHVPPIDIKLETSGISQPFYSHIGGYKLQLSSSVQIPYVRFTLTMLEYELEDETEPPYKMLIIIIKIINQEDDKKHFNHVMIIACPSRTAIIEQKLSSSLVQCIKEGFYILRVLEIRCL